MRGSHDPSLVLAIEDDLRYVRQLRADLESCGCRVVIAGTGARGLVLCAAKKPDVVLLDLGLPDMDALTLLGRGRAICDAPVVAMTSREDDRGVARVLDAGADDYLPKPFDVDHLSARLRAVLRQAPNAEIASPPFELGDLRIDFATAEVRMAGRLVELSASEYRLLGFLARNRERVFKPAQLVGAVWGPAYAGDRHLARVYVRRVREKIERNPSEPRHLVTKPGVGYMLRTHG